MGRMVDGEWITEEEFAEDDGEFQRQETSFRSWVSSDEETPFSPEPDRYHLYISRACPWAHRTALIRRLKGLTEAVGISIVDPYMGEEGWAFSEGEDCVPDTVNGCDYLRELYQLADPNYTGRVTVPVLWDRREETIVNNESLEIMRMLDGAFEPWANQQRTFYPEGHREQIDRIIEALYKPINNGVYRAGFAGSQQAHETAVTELFEALDRWEEHLEQRRFLCGSMVTEADLCFFTTLFRFDAVYHTHFKCNIRRIIDYPNLWNYTRDLYQLPEVAVTCNMDHVKRHYYRSHPSVNPSGLVPLGPDLDFQEPHHRASLSTEDTVFANPGNLIVQ